MGIAMIGRTAGVFILALGLTACADAALEIEILSESTARGQMIISLDRAVYETPQGKAIADEGFCNESPAVFTQDKVVCTMVEEGTFAEISFDEGQSIAERMKITSAGPGLVRVSFPTRTLAPDVVQGDPNDPQTQQIIALFTGHSVTLKVSGGDIVESNMAIAGDGQSAQLVIPIADLVTGMMDAPEEAYAIVRK